MTVVTDSRASNRAYIRFGFRHKLVCCYGPEYSDRFCSYEWQINTALIHFNIDSTGEELAS